MSCLVLASLALAFLGLLRSLHLRASVGVQLRVLAYDDDVDPPYVENLAPASGATLVPVGTAVSMHIKDFKHDDGITAGSGVDLQSIRVTISHGSVSTAYGTGSSAFSFGGIAVNRAITITPASQFPANTTVSVSIDASDLHVPPNVMDTVSYSFLTAPSSSASSSSGGGGGNGNGNGRSGGGGGGGGGNSGGGNASAPGRQKRSSSSSSVRVHSAAPPVLTMFIDVPPGAWYDEALRAMMERGAIDTTPPRFRPADGALRAEMAKMLVKLHGLQPVTTVPPSFEDVIAGAWYAGFVEQAAMHGWMLGYGDCYGTHPCVTKPLQIITRAEAAAMIVRSFALHPLGVAPLITDVHSSAWYAENIRTATDHCVLTGDGTTGLAAPARPVNRAELVTMLDRAMKDLRYGLDCTLGK